MNIDSSTILLLKYCFSQKKERKKRDLVYQLKKKEKGWIFCFLSFMFLAREMWEERDGRLVLAYFFERNEKSA
jgi:high-affinity Fe2+/Pb2+ permease